MVYRFEILSGNRTLCVKKITWIMQNLGVQKLNSITLDSDTLCEDWMQTNELCLDGINTKRIHYGLSRINWLSCTFWKVLATYTRYILFSNTGPPRQTEYFAPMGNGNLVLLDPMAKYQPLFICESILFTLLPCI